MTSITRWGVLLALITAAARPAAAQGVLELTLEDAVTRAVVEAPRVAEARSREAVADATVAARSALGRPVVSALTGVLRTNHVPVFGVPAASGGTAILFPDIPTNYRVRAELSLPLYTGGRVGDLVAAAEADRRAADADRRSTTSDVTLDVVGAYWFLVTARARVDVLERAQARAEASLADVRVRAEAGVLPPSDVFSAQAQRARQNVQLIQATNDAALAEAELGRLVGASPGQPIVTRTGADRPTPGAAEIAGMPLTTLVKRAAESRPERRAIVERQAALRAVADAAGAATHPQVGVVAGIEPARPNARFFPREDDWKTGWDVGVSVTWAVWDGGRASAERSGSIAQAAALGHRADEFDQRVAVEVRQRLLDIASTESALEASNEAVDAAAEARRVLGERFAAGVATNFEMLDADVAWLEAELERTRLRAALRFHEARLLRTVGDW